MLKFFTEMLPLVAFFTAYKFTSLLVATMWLVGATLLGLVILYAAERRVSYVPLISAAVLSVFAALSWFSGDVTYIKMKPTIINLAFATILFGGIFYKKGLMRYVMGEKLMLSDAAWIKLSLRWALFFCALALANEFIWRLCSEAVWVKFKVFGILSLSLLFILFHIPFLQKHRLSD